jgi:hypothetical protein
MTAAFQPELVFSRVECEDPRIDTLIGFLDGCTDWTTAGEIAERLKYLIGMAQFSDRLIRDLASASGGIIAGGARGYRLTRAIPKDEAHHNYNRLIAMSDDTKRRAEEFRAEWLRTHPGERWAEAA